MYIILILFTDLDCRIGDGNGASETGLGLYTYQECIDEVRKQHPDANGATMENPCPNKCRCYAEFDMTDWSGTKWQSCMLKGKLS